MNIEAVRALAQTVAMSTHGVAITVTPPDGPTVTTRGIWIQHADETMPVGRDFQRRDPRRLMAIPINSSVQDVPRGSIVVAAPRGTSTPRTWRVENVDKSEADQVRVIVAPVDNDAIWLANSSPLS